MTTIENNYYRYQVHLGSVKDTKCKVNMIGCGILSTQGDFPEKELLDGFKVNNQEEVGITYSGIGPCEFKRLKTNNCMDHLWYGSVPISQKFISTVCGLNDKKKEAKDMCVNPVSRWAYSPIKDQNGSNAVSSAASQWWQPDPGNYKQNEEVAPATSSSCCLSSSCCSPDTKQTEQECNHEYDKYEEVHELGYAKGYSDGQDKGYMTGFKDGREVRTMELSYARKHSFWSGYLISTALTAATVIIFKLIFG